MSGTFTSSSTQLKENIEKSNSKSVEELYNVVHASLELQKQTYDKLSSIDDRLKTVESRLYATASPTPTVPKGLDPAVILQLQKQIAECIQGIDKRLLNLEKTTQRFESVNKPKPTPATQSSTEQSSLATSNATLSDPNSFSSLQEEMLSWLLKSKEEQGKSLGDLTDLQRNMLRWVLQSDSLRKATQASSVNLPTAQSEQTSTKLPPEFEQEAERFFKEIRKQSQSVGTPLMLHQPSVRNTSARQDADDDDNSVNIMDSDDSEMDYEQERAAGENNQSEVRTEKSDIDSDDMSEDLGKFRFLIWSSLCSRVITLFHNTMCIYIENDASISARRDITLKTTKHVIGNDSKLNDSRRLKAVVAILLGDRLGRGVKATEVEAELTKLKTLGRIVHRKLIKALARQLYDGDIFLASQMLWSTIPRQIKTKYRLLLEKKSLQRNNLEIGRCEQYWAANAILCRLTGQKTYDE